MKDMRDTINNMMSQDYKERLKAEYDQTKFRYERLKRFCNEIEAAEMVPNLKMPKHDCPLYLLRDQQKIMGQYLHILEIRAVIENILLEQ